MCSHHFDGVSRLKQRKWTKEAVLADARQYMSKADWRKAGSGYNIAHRRGWLDEATAHMTPLWESKWSKEAVLADAKRYESRSSWETLSSGAYAAANKNGWYEEATAHMPMLIESWSKDKVIADARRFRTKGEWLANSSSYYIAKNNGWFEEATAHMYTTYSFGELVIITYLLQRDIAFFHQQKFDDLKNVHKLPYDFYLPDYNLLIEYHGIQHKRGWQGNKVDAQEIQNRDAIKRKYALDRGFVYLEIDASSEKLIEELLDTCIGKISQNIGVSYQPVVRILTPKEQSLIANLGVWTKDAVLESALQFGTKSDWKKAHGAAYNKALQMGWLKEAAAHMKSPQRANGYWTRERVIESAKPFLTQVAWKHNFGGAWSKAVAMGWIPDATAHMTATLTRKPSGYWTRERVFEIAAKFKSVREWRANSPSSLAIAQRNGWIEEAKNLCNKPEIE